jgi:cytochrome c556
MAGKAVYRKMASKIGGLQATKRLYGDYAAMNKPIFKKHLNSLSSMSTLPKDLTPQDLQTVLANFSKFKQSIPADKISNKFGANFGVAQYFKYFGTN